MDASFGDDDEYIPFFTERPPLFAHNQHPLLGRPVQRSLGAGPVLAENRGGGEGALLRVLNAPPFPGPAGAGAQAWGPLSLPLSPHGSEGGRSSVVISELEGSEDDDEVVSNAASYGPGAHLRSSRLALLEPATFVSIEEKAVKRRALKEALLGCPPRLQGKAFRNKVVEAVVRPLGRKAVAELRAAAAIPSASVPRSGDA